MIVRPLVGNGGVVPPWLVDPIPVPLHGPLPTPPAAPLSNG